MSKYKLIKMPDPDNEFDYSTVTYEFQSVELPVILEELEDFLRGTGFPYLGTLKEERNEEK